MQKVLLIFLICSTLAFVKSKPNTEKMNWWTEGNATIFSPESFKEAVGQDKDIVVQFWASYCRFSQALVPEYEKLVELYSGENAKRKDIVIAKLDGYTFKEISKQYGIDSYPQIVLFKKGSKEIASKFNMPRYAANMADWIEKVLPQPAESEKKEETLQADTPIPQADSSTNTSQETQQKTLPLVENQQNQQPGKSAETQKTKTTLYFRSKGALDTIGKLYM